MHAPIELGPRLYGVLSVTHEQPGRFGEAELELLARLARSSAAAIANALDFERERRLARALTLGFVPEALPELPEYETGLLYAPALGESTGGDVYGAWRLPAGEIAVLVGDVAGKGVETAALSAMVRFFVEARSWDSPAPGLVLEQANSMLLNRLPPVPGRAGAGARALRQRRPPPALPPLGRRRAQPRRPRAAARDRGRAALRGGRAAPRAGRRGLRLHRRPDRGPPRAGLVHRLAADHAPASLVRAVHAEIAAWADGLTDDAVALALRRRR
jgi:hypothetical protein